MKKIYFSEKAQLSVGSDLNCHTIFMTQFVMLFEHLNC